MQQELLQVIEKNLPSEVGKTLQKRLALCDDLEIQVANWKTEFEKLKTATAEVTEKYNILKGREVSIIDQANANDKKEKELQQKEIKLDKSNAELKAAESEKRADQLKEVLGIVFRSPIYKRTYQENNNGTCFSDYNNGQNKTIPAIIPQNKNTIEEIINE